MSSHPYSTLSICSNGEKIFALIIGINDYGHDGLYNLKGAVTDAKRIEKFLRTKLKVPDTNISYLHDKKATRPAIIKAFRSLENNKAIVKNDAAIIIYYAGHGSVVDKPKAWEGWFAPDDRIEMLCPSDMTLSDSDVPGIGRVEGIADRTISRLLLDLSIAKGDNIVRRSLCLPHNSDDFIDVNTRLLPFCWYEPRSRRRPS